MTPKKILVVAPFAFGYTAHIHKALQSYQNVEASILYLDQPAFSYKNSFHKVQNFISKLFLAKNLKKAFVVNRLKSSISELGKQDIVFIIRPDLLDDATLQFIKDHTQEFIAYYYDSTRRFPRKLEITSFFDKIYSYDKQDVEKHNFQFLTNYIFEESSTQGFSYQFFNISTNDYRFPLLEKLASYLKKRGWTYKMLLYNGSEMSSEFLEVITEQQSIEQVSDFIKQCKIVVEIQRTEQIGLSFRIFEALGHNKKLITTNKDIVNYDFYHPQNILVIDENRIEIPDEFVKSPYLKIEDAILDKYKVENWVRPIFGL